MIGMPSSASLRDRVMTALERVQRGLLTRADAETLLRDVVDFLEKDVNSPLPDTMPPSVAVDRAITAMTPPQRAIGLFILEALGDHDEGLIQGSKVAARLCLSRSQVVHAVKLLEVAGAVDSRARGRKGTWIRVRVPDLAERLRGHLALPSFYDGHEPTEA